MANELIHSNDTSNHDIYVYIYMCVCYVHLYIYIYVTFIYLYMLRTFVNRIYMSLVQIQNGGNTRSQIAPHIFKFKYFILRMRTGGRYNLRTGAVSKRDTGTLTTSTFPYSIGIAFRQPADTCALVCPFKQYTANVLFLSIKLSHQRRIACHQNIRFTRKRWNV